jgi:hypothetical protein
MKTLIFLCLSLAVGPITYAKDLELIVLKLGDIQSATFTELSRELRIEPNPNVKEPKPTSKWVDVKDGKQCVALVKSHRDEWGELVDDTSPYCRVGTIAEMGMFINGRFDISYTRSYWESRRGKTLANKKAEDFISNDDIEKVRSVDLSDNSDHLTLLYDVNVATPFFENNEYYLKQIRIFFDRSSQKVDHYSIEKVVIPKAK